MKLTKKKFIDSTSVSLFVLLLFFSFSGRSFSGLTFQGVRIGEVTVAGFFVCSLAIFWFKNSKYSKELTLFRFIILGYIFYGYIINKPIYSDYLIKSSSYIWLMSVFFVSLIVFKSINDKSWLYVLYLFLPFILYITELIYYPEILKNFYLNFSDKFDYMKGSDLALIIISSQILSITKIKKLNIKYPYVLITSGLWIPFLLYKSKGAFVGAIIFFLYFIIVNFKFIFFNKKNIFIFMLFIAIFIFSTNLVAILNLKSSASNNTEVLDISSSIDYVIESKNSNKLFNSIYFINGRFYSTENNINWRLDIWQDVIINLIKKDLIFKGYGYSETIPEMTLEHRTGWDGTNENPHNFIINILARGGIISVFIYLIFFVYLSLSSYKKSKNNLLLIYIISSMSISFFDAVNESVRYPYIFFMFLGFIYLNFDKTSKIKLSND